MDSRYTNSIAYFKAILNYLAMPKNMGSCLFPDIISYTKQKLVFSCKETKYPKTLMPRDDSKDSNIDDSEIFDHKKAMYCFGIVALVELSNIDGKHITGKELDILLHEKKANVYHKCGLTLLEASFVEHCLMSNWKKRKTATEMLEHLYMHPEDIAQSAWEKINTTKDVQFNEKKRVNSKVSINGGGFGIIKLVLKVPQANRKLRLYVEKTQTNQDGESNTKYKELISREIKINKIIAKENIEGCVKIFDSSCRVKTHTMKLKMEYVPSPNLAELCDRYGALPEATVRSIMKTAITALNCIHRLGIVYRDFKQSNILVVFINEKLCGKLIDFGIAKELDKNAINNTIIGTPETVAPEVVMGEISLKSDIYSIGATCFKTLFNKPLFVKKNPLPNYNEFYVNYTIPKGRCLSIACIDFLQNCLQIKPDQRFASLNAMLKHSFFNAESTASMTFQERDYQLTTTKLIDIA